MIILRRTQPDLPRTFKVPLYPLTPILAVLFCGYLMMNLGVTTWVVFGIWMIVGAAIYMGYGRKKSKLAANWDLHV